MSETRERPQMRLLAYRRIAAGKVWGVASVLLPIGLEIRDVLILEGKDGLWAKLPSKKDERGYYTDMLRWETRALQDGFSRRLLQLVEAAHPGEVSQRVPSELSV